MSDDVLVRGHDLARTHGTGATAVVAVHGANFEIRSADRIAVVGPSGSGKTTLLHMIAGLDEPTAGTISWPGIGARQDLRPGAVAIIFQSPSLMPPLDVLENVALPLLLQGIASDTAMTSALSALATLDLDGLANKLPEELSGGQAQRVAVARVLAARPRLILADEPTGQLDHATGKHVMDVLLAAADHMHAALLVNTHDLAIADRLAARWVMHDGRLAAINVVSPC